MLMAHCLCKNVFTTIIIFLKWYGSHLTPIFSSLEAIFSGFGLASFLLPRPCGEWLDMLLWENFMAPLERQSVSGYMKGEIIFPLSPATTEETINKILSSLEVTFSLWRAERGTAEWPGQTHPPGAPPFGSFHRGLPPAALHRHQPHDWPHWLSHAYSLVVPSRKSKKPT